MEKSNFEMEKELWEAGYEMVIGVDEAGKGPLAGPVVACAVVLKNICHSAPSPLEGEGWGEVVVRDKSYANLALQSSLIRPRLAGTSSPGGRRGNPKSKNYKLQTKNWNLIRDSKMLSAKQRESLFDFIHEHFYVGVGICDHKTIDRINIFQAGFLAMKAALTDLKKKYWIPDQVRDDNFKKTIILLDGRAMIPNFSEEQKAIVRGDKLIKSISAASIIAKVTRDRIMMEMHEKYPEYGFDKHKGYGTALHMAKLQEYGPCEIHRQSFAPVRMADRR